MEERKPEAWTRSVESSRRILWTSCCCYQQAEQANDMGTIRIASGDDRVGTESPSLNFNGASRTSMSLASFSKFKLKILQCSSILLIRFMESVFFLQRSSNEKYLFLRKMFFVNIFLPITNWRKTRALSCSSRQDVWNDIRNELERSVWKFYLRARWVITWIGPDVACCIYVLRSVLMIRT